MLKTFIRITALIGTVAALCACKTVEEDYGLDMASVAQRCDNSLNRPVVSASANGSYSAAPVNTQTINCAGTTRTFEIISDRAGE